MRKLLKPLRSGQCALCSRRTLVRTRYNYAAKGMLQTCVSCSPVDGDDMTYESIELVLHGH